MDLSNRESAEYWHRRAEEVEDRDLRKEALTAHRKYRRMAEREERIRIRRENPGYGVRSMFGWIMLISLTVAAAILGLSYFFSLKAILSVFSIVVAISVVAWAITLRVYGHIGEASMLSMIKLGMGKLFQSSSGVSIDASVEPHALPDSSPAHRLPPPAPKVSFDRDEDAKGV